MKLLLARFMYCNLKRKVVAHYLMTLFEKLLIARLLIFRMLLLGLFAYSLFYMSYAETQKIQNFLPQKPLTAMQGSFLSWYQQCTKKNYVSCGLVGKAYYEGYGVLPNMSMAKSYFTKACYNGVVESCLFLEDFTKENAKQEYSILLYQQACDLDDKESCVRLLDFLLKGATKDIDDSKKDRIVNILDKICKLENDKECLKKKSFEAQFYMNSNMLLAVEFQQALATCKKAQQEDSNDMRSCVDVGLKYANGLGVTKNKQEAQVYFHIACKKHSEFCRYELLDSVLN